MRIPSLVCLITCAGALAGCALGPQYFTPDTALPVNFVTPPAGNGPGGATRAQCVWIGTSRKNRSEKVSTRSSIRKRRVRSR